MRLVLATVLLVLLTVEPGSAQWQELLKGLATPPPGRERPLDVSGLSDSKIASGLKEALQIGTENLLKEVFASR